MVCYGFIKDIRETFACHCIIETLLSNPTSKMLGLHLISPTSLGSERFFFLIERWVINLLWHKYECCYQGWKLMTIPLSGTGKIWALYRRKLLNFAYFSSSICLV